jgi:hypothetical protein
VPKILLTSLLVLISVLVFGQRWQFAGGPGAVLYKGDLLDWHYRPNRAQLAKMSPSVNLQVRYQEKKTFAYRAKLNFSSLQGDGSLHLLPVINYSTNTFSSPLIDLSLITEYNFLDYQSNRKIKNWTPYLYGGFSGMFVSPTGSIPNPMAFFTFSIPYGVGIKYQINPTWGVQFECGTSMVLSDVIDGMPSYEGVGSILRSPDKISFSQGDQFLNSSLMLTYSIVSIFCP